MLRLIERARAGTGDPEIFAGLVHACRYCGLLDAAVSAYQHARRLDPDVRTSIGHAYWMLGECEKAIESDQERVMSHQWAEPSNLRSPPSRCAIVIVEEPDQVGHGLLLLAIQPAARAVKRIRTEATSITAGLYITDRVSNLKVVRPSGGTLRYRADLRGRLACYGLPARTTA
jgi:hypothetical protein